MQQLKNYFTMLLLSAGTPMFVMGDEFARTQGGLDNPYNIDSEVTWVDWSRLDTWAELHAHVRQLLNLRRTHRPAIFRFYGPQSPPDTSEKSRSLAWASAGLYVMSNASWDPVRFTFQEEGPWVMAVSTVAPETSLNGATLAPRSMVVWRRAEPAVTSGVDE
jgi:glycogen operon protein